MYYLRRDIQRMKLRCNQDARNFKINRIWNVGLGKLQLERKRDREEGRKNGRKLWAIKFHGGRGGVFQTQ